MKYLTRNIKRILNLNVITFFSMSFHVLLFFLYFLFQFFLSFVSVFFFKINITAMQCAVHGRT